MAHQARKRFGQNFLEDHGIIYQIIASIQAQKGQHWVEIGPGQGALTHPLLETGVTLDVVELDRDLVTLLTQKFEPHPQLTIHSADALKFDFQALVNSDEKLRIIGNLPYNISTPLLFHLLSNAHSIADMHFMLQKEVVERICAVPGSKKYGRLTVMMNYYCASEHLFDVPPESFKPIPKVNSAIVRLIPHSTAPVTLNERKTLNTIVTAAFSQRRKTIRNSLKKHLNEDQIKQLGIDPKVRAEEVGLEDFAKLANFFNEISE
ncbi:MAG: 16S rRNA (adenine(1518)-N(6)/adenine(1519)-N(6))-dimethyltransferase RsmA [Methylococcales bacterium]|nr:16S rRNA (adenine(1518)-N(6)/adenine(1519)-N(6))-dimethyltransferase RsmA [Methylococcales bacterium]